MCMVVVNLSFGCRVICLVVGFFVLWLILVVVMVFVVFSICSIWVIVVCDRLVFVISFVWVCGLLVVSVLRIV